MRYSLLIAALAVSSLSGCAHHHRPLADNHLHNQHHITLAKPQTLARHHHGSDIWVDVEDNQLQPPIPTPTPFAPQYNGWQPPANSYRPAYTHKLLGDYAEQIAMKLVENMRYVSVNTPVAVASFVDLNSNLNQTNILGNQLAESFITELQEFGIPVLDIKTTQSIHVGPSGDFVFSRSLKELNNNPGVKYVLSGTMTYNDAGVILNVRMVDLASKLVVASSKGFVPQFVVNSLLPAGMRDGIVLNSVGD